MQSIRSSGSWGRSGACSEKGDNMGLIWSIIIGAIAGCIASAFMNEKSGLIKNILLGILGGFVGGFLFGLIGFHADGTIARLVVSVIGACICIWIGRKLFR